MHPLAVLGPPQPFHQLVQRHVERCVLVVKTCLGPHDGALHVTGDLDAFAGLGLTLVRLVAHDDVDALYAWRELRDLGQLLVEVVTESV